MNQLINFSDRFLSFLIMACLFVGAFFMPYIVLFCVGFANPYVIWWACAWTVVLVRGIYNFVNPSKEAREVMEKFKNAVDDKESK